MMPFRDECAIDSARTMTDVLRFWVDRRPAAEACRFIRSATDLDAAQIVTFGDLDRWARPVAGRLRDAVPRGARVLLLHETGPAFLVALFGCFYAGAAAVPLYPPLMSSKLAKLRAILLDAQPSAVLCAARHRDKIAALLAGEDGLRDLPCIATDPDALDLRFGSQDLEPPDEDALAVIQYTSGSTSRPRGVMVSHRNLIRQSRAITERFRWGPRDRSLTWLPHHHDMGLVGGLLHPLIQGTPSVILSPLSFLVNPACWLDAVSRFGITITGGPNFAYDYCVDKIPADRRSRFRLDHWSVAFVGADTVHAATLRRFAETFRASGFGAKAFYACYGLAEATLLATGGRRGEGVDVRSVTAAHLGANRILPTDGGAEVTVVGCGLPPDDADLLIVDPANRMICPPLAVGEVWLSSPSVGQGYWNAPEATDEVFHARTADGAGPYLRTGDLGFVEDRQLFITGRIKDVIILQGRNHYPHDIERTILDAAGGTLAACAVFGIPAARGMAVQAVAEIAPEGEAELAAGGADRIRNVLAAAARLVADVNEVEVHRVLVVRRKSLPRTTSGKMQRAKCRDAALAGFFIPLVAWDAPSHP